jgi:hypothetical protein
VKKKPKACFWPLGSKKKYIPGGTGLSEITVAKWLSLKTPIQYTK